MKGEVFSGFRLAATSAEELFGFEVRLISAEVASASLQSSEESQLAACVR